MYLTHKTDPALINCPTRSITPLGNLGFLPHDSLPMVEAHFSSPDRLAESELGKQATQINNHGGLSYLTEDPVAEFATQLTLGDLVA